MNDGGRWPLWQRVRFHPPVGRHGLDDRETHDDVESLAPGSEARERGHHLREGTAEEASGLALCDVATHDGCRLFGTMRELDLWCILHHLSILLSDLGAALSQR